MTLSLIRILSITIFIAQQQDNKILTILLYDYAKPLLSKKQFILLKILVVSYKENKLLMSQPLYLFINQYLIKHSNKVCKNLLHT